MLAILRGARCQLSTSRRGLYSTFSTGSGSEDLGKILRDTPGFPPVNAQDVDGSTSVEQGSESTDGGPPPPMSQGTGNVNKTIDDLLNTNPTYGLHVRASRNNTIMTVQTPEQGTFTSISGGRLGFKGVNRSTYEAGFACALHIFKKIFEEYRKHPFHLHIYLIGFGQGRDAVYRALMTPEGNDIRRLVVQITDKTPLKIGGTRPKKARRL